MRKKLLVVFALFALILVLGATLCVGAKTPPAVSLDKMNLAFEDNVYILYAVELQGAEANALPKGDFGLLIWRTAQEDYQKGSELKMLTPAGYEDIDGTRYYVFEYTDLSAKEMTDDVFARAFVTVDGTTYYSNVEKYSILQYAYNKLGKINPATATQSQKLKDLLNGMLEYGALAQINFNYKADRLATADFYQIKVEGGTLADGFTKGLFLAGERVTLKASAENAEQAPFSHWQNSAGKSLGTEHTLSVSAEAHDTYTAVYENYDYLTFTLLNDGTYSVTVKEGATIPAVVAIPANYQGKAVTSVGNKAFYNSKALSSITVPNTVTSIGDRAFYYCTSLTSVTVPSSITSIGNGAFYGCTKLNAVYIKDLTAWCQIDFESSPSSPLFYAPNFYLNEKLITDIVIPTGVTSIKQFAFRNYKALASVTIPNTVTSIGGNAFAGCTNFTDVYYDGTESEWNVISIASSNASLLSAKIHFAKDKVANSIVTEIKALMAKYPGQIGMSDGAAALAAANSLQQKVDLFYSTYNEDDSLLTVDGTNYALELARVTARAKLAIAHAEKYATLTDSAVKSELTVCITISNMTLTSASSYDQITNALEYALDQIDSFADPLHYTVTFKDWDGTILKTQTVEHGNSATAPTAPTRDGYTFAGWSGSFNNVTTNQTVVATYAQMTNTRNLLEMICVDNQNGTLTLTVAIKGNTVSFSGIEGFVSFDTSKLSYSAKKKLSSFSGSVNYDASDSNVYFALAGSENRTESENLFSITFTYTEAIDTTITLTVTDIYDQDYNTETYTIIGGKVVAG